MSATRGIRGQVHLGHYPTPDWAIRAIVPEFPHSGSIVDAGCGAGAILGVLRRVLGEDVHLVGVEIQRALFEQAVDRFADDRRSMIEEHDFLTWIPPIRIDLAVFNPPFALALPFIQKALAITEPQHGSVAALLRVDWLAPDGKGRGDFLDQHPPDVFVLDRRPQFRMALDGKRGTDSCEYAWMIWGPGRVGRWKRIRCERSPKSRILRQASLEASAKPAGGGPL